MAQCISRLESSIYGEMTEGITHCRIVMGRGGGEMECRARDKNTEIVAVTGCAEAGDTWANILFLLKVANTPWMTVN